MPKAPDPITSPPPVPGQPYSATAPGRPEDQVDSGTIYDASGGPGSGDSWPKIQEAGAADMATGKVTGGWPGNGASSDGGWTQC